MTPTGPNHTPGNGAAGNGRAGNGRGGNGHGLPSGASLREALEARQQTGFYPRGSVLFQHGSAPAGIYLVRSGAVRLMLARPGVPPVVLRTAGAGELLGLSAAVGGRPHLETAIMAEGGELAFIARPRLMELFTDQPRSAFELLLSLSGELAGAYRCLRTFTVATRAPRALASNGARA